VPHRNRVRPDGEIVATTARGTMMGNRGGCFHRDDGRQKQKPWASIHWIACVLDFKGRRRRIRQPGLYTELFFLDEATALAAGHRPCFECRRAEALQFQAFWAKTHDQQTTPKVAAMDTVLQQQRIDPPYAKRTTPTRIADLPDGAMVRIGEAPALIWRGRVRRWTFEGYADDLSTTQKVDLLTPPAIVAILRAGYPPKVHPSVTAARE
jgi:hypothetical protein